MSAFDEQLTKMKSAKGFIGALDNSGGSTPGVLTGYGVSEDTYSDEEEMYGLVHDMRTRIMTSPAFTGERIVASILYENTLWREVGGKPTANYLWEEKNIVPILKVDKGLEEEKDGARLLKPITGLSELLEKAKAQPVFGTKMRSVITLANEAGIEACVAQQFDIAREIMAAGLVPIIEPEIDIHSPEKKEAEDILKASLLRHLDTLADNEHVIFKLTLPEEPNLYTECIEHKNIVRVVALSGGYSREEATKRLTQNHNMIASFNRGLTEGLQASQSDEEFNTMLDNSIESIYQASIT